MPVPKDRTDVAYVKALTDLRGYGDTLLYLSLIHHGDQAGDRARIDAARNIVTSFGVSSECGWDRTDQPRVPGLLESHRLALAHLEAS